MTNKKLEQILIELVDLVEEKRAIDLTKCMAEIVKVFDKESTKANDIIKDLKSMEPLGCCSDFNEGYITCLNDMNRRLKKYE